MKKLVMFLALMMLALQSITAKSVKTIINEYRDKSKAEYFYVSPAMMMITKAAIKKYDDETAKMIAKINSMRILNLGACKSSTKKKFYKEIANLDEEEYQPVFVNGQKDKGSLAFIKINPDGNSELVSLITSSQDNCMLFQVEGTITMEELQKLIDGNKIPGMDH